MCGDVVDDVLDFSKKALGTVLDPFGVFSDYSPLQPFDPFFEDIESPAVATPDLNSLRPNPPEPTLTSIGRAESFAAVQEDLKSSILIPVDDITIPDF